MKYIKSFFESVNTLDMFPQRLNKSIQRIEGSGYVVTVDSINPKNVQIKITKPDGVWDLKFLGKELHYHFMIALRQDSDNKYLWKPQFSIITPSGVERKVALNYENILYDPEIKTVQPNEVKSIQVNCLRGPELGETQNTEVTEQNIKDLIIEWDDHGYTTKIIKKIDAAGSVTFDVVATKRSHDLMSYMDLSDIIERMISHLTDMDYYLFALSLSNYPVAKTTEFTHVRYSTDWRDFDVNTDATGRATTSERVDIVDYLSRRGNNFIEARFFVKPIPIGK